MWNYFASILVMGLFAGCSNDTLTGDDSDGELNGSKDAVYMNVSVQLPAGGAARSETDTPDNGDYVTSEDGIEIGKDYENEDVNNGRQTHNRKIAGGRTPFRKGDTLCKSNDFTG